MHRFPGLVLALGFCLSWSLIPRAADAAPPDPVDPDPAVSNALRYAEEFGGSLDLDTGAEGASFVLRLPALRDPAEARTRAP